MPNRVKARVKKSKANVVEEITPALPQSSPVPEAVRQNIQQLIQEKQFSAAGSSSQSGTKKKTIPSTNCIYYFLKFILLKR